ncbi:MAG: cytochrome P450 [Pseudomonadota bacterium]
MNRTGWTVPAHVPQELVVDFNFMNPPGGEDDIHLAWASLHDGPDIVWSPYNGGHWIATRGADIEVLQKDFARFSSCSISIPPTTEVKTVPLELDPPEHTPFRALIAPSFLPQAVASLEADMRTLSIELIEAFRQRGECEFVSEFAKILPIVIFLRLADLPLEDRDRLLDMAEMAVRGDLEMRMQAIQDLGQYIGKWVVERQANPGKDLVSLMANAQIDGAPISPERMFGMMIVVLFGGLDTVASLLGFIARFLAENPAQRQQLIDQPDLINSAIDELVRRFGVSSTARVITADMEFNGVQLKENEQILVPSFMYGLDERKFPNPLMVDVTRKPVVHAAFGNGPHRCPGSFLARVEIKVFVQEWLKRIPHFSIKPGDKPRCGSGAVNGMLYLPLVWDVSSTIEA